MCRLLFVVVFFVVLIPRADAQQFDFPETVAQDPAMLSKSIVRSAHQVLPVYKDDDKEAYLSNVSSLQAVAGEYPLAIQSLVALRDYRRSTHVFNATWRDLQYEIYTRAKSAASAQRLPFDEAYRQAFSAAFAQLDGPTSARAMPLFNVVDESWMDPALQSDLDARKGNSSIAFDAAVSLIRDYEAVQAYRDTASLRPALIAEDDSRRYTIERDVQVKTGDGATVCALVARPKAATGRLPALLLFTIYSISPTT